VAENERATADIVRQIRAVVEKIAQEQALTLVLDAASGFVVYADRSLDITPAVLTELAAQVQSGAAR
jgi:Skp family chaperone for outer membrane proteins